MERRKVRVDPKILKEVEQRLQARLAAGDRREVEVRRDHGQVREGPLAALDVVLLGRTQLQQMAHRGRQDVLVVLEVILMLREAAQRSRDVGGNGRLLGDDQCF